MHGGDEKSSIEWTQSACAMTGARDRVLAHLNCLPLAVPHYDLGPLRRLLVPGYQLAVERRTDRDVGREIERLVIKWLLVAG